MSLNPGSQRLALLVDCDNVPGACADGLMRDLAHLGQATVREAFGDFRLAQSETWSAACSKHEIREVQVDLAGRGKNAADVAMTVRAMDLVHQKMIDGLALVSGDSDFVPLVERLGSGGVPVYVFALKHAPDRLRDAASRFVHIENLLAKHPANATSTNVKPLRRSKDFLPLLERTIVALRDLEGWVTINRLHEELLAGNRHFDPRDYGYRRLLDLCASLRRIVVERREGGEERVRLKKVRRRRKRRGDEELIDQGAGSSTKRGAGSAGQPKRLEGPLVTDPDLPRLGTKANQSPATGPAWKS